ncbi:hypothetical protein [Microtetraspora niveoalba]|uniref:hypothetical protein n=1 Tax=Microtetraspora niveoalba TaxID=46175 RepID=UPI0008310806|nr:hypothetical protein [Microtetraspora niveoalba]
MAGSSDGSNASTTTGRATNIPSASGFEMPDVSSPWATTFSKDAVKATGKAAGDLQGHMTGTATNTSKIDVAYPGFGIVGLGLDDLHRNARTNVVKSLRAAAEVLVSWQDALTKASDNYHQADEAAKAKIEKTETQFDPKNIGPGGGPDLGKLGEDGPGDLGLNGPGDRLDDGPKLPDSNLPDPNLDGTDPSGSGLPDSGTPNTDLPTTNIPDPNLSSSGQSGLDRDGSGLTPNTPDLSGLGANPTSPLNDATKLASYTPGNVQIPGGANSWTGEGPGAGPYGGGTSGGYGTSGGAAGTRSPGGGGASGMGGMPYMPPMGGAAGGAGQDRDREKSNLLSGDESDWDDGGDVAPAVITHTD